MTCREFITFLLDYFGELDAAQRARFDAHLAVCPGCVNYLKSYREAIRLGKAALADPEEPIPDELAAAILAAREKR